MVTKVEQFLQSIAPQTNQTQSIADEFNQKTKDLDPVKREQAKQRILPKIAQAYGENALKEFDSLTPIEAPERGFTGAVSDFAKYAGIAIDAAQQPFFDLYDPSSQAAIANREEKKKLEQSLSPSQRLADYRAQQNMARAKAAGESGIGAWFENLAESPLRQGGELFSSVLPAAATTAALANPWSVAASGGTSLAALPAALGGLGATQAVGAQRGDIYERVVNAKDEDLLKASPEYLKLRQGLNEQDAKRELGTRIQDNLGTLAGAAAIGGVMDRFGGTALRTLLSGGAKGIKAKAAGIAKEAVTEGISEGGEQVLSNVAFQKIDPKQSLTEDVALNAVLGAVAGGGLGTASAVGGAFRQEPESVVDKILAQDVEAQQAAPLGLPAPESRPLGLPEPEGYSQRLRQGYQDPGGGYATIDQGQGIIEGQDLRGQTPIEMGTAFGYPQATEKKPYQDTTDIQEKIEKAASEKTDKTPTVSKEVQQRIEEAASQAPESVQQRLEKVKKANPDQFVEVAADYVSKRPQVEYIEPQGNKINVYDYDAALKEVNDDMDAIVEDYNTRSIASIISGKGGISVDERNDLTGMGGKASQKYVGLFRDNARSLHSILNDGELNDYLPQEMRIYPTMGEPMDTQPAYDWIGDKLRSESVVVSGDQEAEYMLQNLERAANSIQEAASQDSDFINYKAWKAQQPVEQDFYQTTGTQPTQEIKTPEKTFSQKNVDEASQVLEGINNALTESQRSQIAEDDLLELGRLIHGSRFESARRVSENESKPVKDDTTDRKTESKTSDADTRVDGKKRLQPKRTAKVKREKKASIAKQEGSNTRDNVEQKIKSVFGDNALKNIDIKSSKEIDSDGDVQAFYNPKTKRITLVADRINQDEEVSVYLHEIFHKNKEALGKKYSELVSRVNKWESAKEGSIEKEIYDAAKQRADESGETGLDYDEELIAYTIEEAVNRGVELNPNKVADNTAEGFLAYVYRVFSNALKKLVPSYNGSLSADDLVSIAYGLANIDIQTNTQAETQQESVQESLKEDISLTDEQEVKFSRSKKVEDIEDFAKDGKIKEDDSLIQAMKNQTMALYLSGKKEQALGFGDKMLTAFADSLVPVVRWIDELKIPEQTKATFKGAMYRAAGMRDYQNEYINTNYIKKFNKQIAKMYHENKHKYTEEELKRIVGYWMSARHSIEANKRLIKQDRLELQRAQNEHAQKNTKETQAAVDKAQKELTERLDAVAGRTKGKVAGGFSEPKAKKIMADFEKLVGDQALLSAAKPLYDSLQYKLKIDLESGKITQEQYDEWVKEKTYVPLTGDPRSLIEEDEDDFISSGGGVNQQRDRAMKGRVSVAEDGVDATIRALSKSTAFYGWKPFKDMLNSVYEQALQDKLSTGLSMDKAKEAVAGDYGIIRTGRMGMARTTDKVIFSKVMGKDVQFQLKDGVIDALQGTYIEDLNSGLMLIGAPTRWMARGVTQFTPQFGLLNMVRDVLEKDTFVRAGVNKAYDTNGKEIKNGRIANTFLSNILSTQFRDTMKAAWKGDFSGKYGKDLQTLMKKGGLSTVGQFLSRTEKDVVNDIQKETKLGKIGASKAVQAVESFNQMFDLMPSLALYRAYVSNGVDEDQAATLTLDTMNFRKRGSKMALPRALYMFAQPTVTGAVNLGRTLKTRNGKIILASYIVAGYALYSALRAMDDEDEGGNKMDQLGDVTRFIPVPLGNGKYVKIPMGFGLPQLGWNFAVNVHKAINGDITPVDAFSNMAFHWGKVLSPVSPSEVPASKYFGEKIALTFTPSILQPVAQNVLNRNAFGSTITTSFARSDKLKAEQSKSTTADFWKDVAVDIQRKTGWDFHPEQIKNLVDGYSVSVMRDAVNVIVENPNRKELGRETKTPLINSLYGAGNEFSIQSRYYEALEEARAVKAEYDSRLKRGDTEGFLTPENKKIIDWYKRAEKNENRVSAQKSKATKRFNKGNMTDEDYRQVVVDTVKKREGVQRPLLQEWRKMKGLNTN